LDWTNILSITVEHDVINHFCLHPVVVSNGVVTVAVLQLINKVLTQKSDMCAIVYTHINDAIVLPVMKMFIIDINVIFGFE